MLRHMHDAPTSKGVSKHDVSSSNTGWVISSLAVCCVYVEHEELTTCRRLS